MSSQSRVGNANFNFSFLSSLIMRIEAKLKFVDSVKEVFIHSTWCLLSVTLSISNQRSLCLPSMFAVLYQFIRRSRFGSLSNFTTTWLQIKIQLSRHLSTWIQLVSTQQTAAQSQTFIFAMWRDLEIQIKTFFCNDTFEAKLNNTRTFDLRWKQQVWFKAILLDDVIVDGRFLLSGTWKRRKGWMALLISGSAFKPPPPSSRLLVKSSKNFVFERIPTLFFDCTKGSSSFFLHFPSLERSFRIQLKCAKPGHSSATCRNFRAGFGRMRKECSQWRHHWMSTLQAPAPKPAFVVPFT